MKSPQTAIVPQRHVHFLAILTCLLTYFAPLWMGASPLWGQETKRVKKITKWLKKDKKKQTKIRTNLKKARASAKAGKKFVHLKLSHLKLTSKDLEKIFFIMTEGSEWKDLSSKITSLDIYGNDLKTLPPTLGRFPNLKKLYASHSKIKKIPVEIGKLKELEMLYLGHNQIVELPGEIAKLKKLSYLSLINNQLKFLPLEMASLEKLKSFWCFDNSSFAVFPERPSEGWKSLSQAMASSESKCHWKSDVREKIYTFLMALRHQYQDSPQCYRVMKTLTKELLSPMLPSNHDEHFELHVGGKKVKHLYIPRAFFEKVPLHDKGQLFRGVENKYARFDASAISGLAHRLIVNFLKQNPKHEIYYD